MVYTPIRTIVVQKRALVESSDLTVPLSSFAGKQAYLAVEKSEAVFVLDIGQILLFQTGLSLSTPIGSVFTALLNDTFVTRYHNNSIPIKNDNGIYNNRLKVFDPGSYKDHRIQFTSINTPTILDDVTKKGYLDDLVITTRSDVANYLVAVNGVFHRTAIHQGKLYVLDGFRTMRLSSLKDVTAVDTSPIGGHSVIPLTSSNVALSQYNGLATITTTQSLRNKSVFLVIDGYFYHQETDVFYFGDDKHIKVKTNKLPLIDQFRHNPRTIYHPDRYSTDASQKSRKYDDAFDALFLNKRFVPTAQLQTRDFQYSRLTNYHSFLVVVNNPNIFPVNYDVLPTGTPQFYRDHADRVVSGMMQHSVGLCPSYLILKDPFKRKSFFIQRQDYDLGLYRTSIAPSFIPSLLEQTEESARLQARFIDYVSA